MSEQSQPPTIDEAALARRAMAGDREALEAVLRRHWRRLRIVAGSLVPAGEADDVLQNVCLRVLGGIATLREPERLVAWLGAITRHEALNWRQTRRKNGACAIPEGLEPVTSENRPPVEQAEERAIVRQAVEALPDHYRQVVLLKYMGDLDYAEIAKILDITVSSVQNRLYRARREIARRLEETGLNRQPRGKHERTRV